MKKIFPIALFLMLTACDRKENSPFIASNSPTVGRGDEPGGSGMDVGNDIEIKFRETQTLPSPMGCNGQGWRFDGRIKSGHQWKTLMDVRRPGVIARSQATTTVLEKETYKVKLGQDVKLTYSGGESRQAKLEATADVTTGFPVVHEEPIDDSSGSAMEELLAFDTTSNCEFTPESRGQRQTKQGRFSLGGGLPIKKATLVTQTVSGHWKCLDEAGYIFAQENQATQVSKVITTYEIPIFLPLSECQANPVYVYVNVVDKENRVLESYRQETQEYSFDFHVH